MAQKITAADPSDIQPALDCLVDAFSEDPITGFLLGSGHDGPVRLAQFFSLLMRARVALRMPVLVARGGDGMLGAAMGYTTARPAWPAAIEDEWNHFESSVPGLVDRMALYDEIAQRCKPPMPHYYLGVIGVEPTRRGTGVGTRLLEAFCELSALDPLSGGVYLETANPSNVAFYGKAGFEVVGQGRLGIANLWCLFQAHGRRRGA